jgi:tetratricopeptide (TPR) repeat protein
MVNAALRLPEIQLIGADCSEQFGAAEPYEPFVEAFRNLVAQEQKPGSRWSNLRELASEVAPAWLEVIPVAGALISASVTTAMELKKGGTATAAPSEEALLFQYTELFFAAAAKHPLVLIIDDLHWADAASVSLLAHLGRRIKDKPILIIGTYRPADVDVTRHPIRAAKLELERYGVSEELPLPPLDERALAALVEEQLDAPGTPELLQWLTRHAGENPLFFSELLRWLVEQGFARLQHGEWALVRMPESIEVPRSAESAIERRLSRLDPEVYKVIEYASVAGNEFDSMSLALLLGMDELALEEAMEPVVSSHRLARLVDTRELPNGDLASIYHFTHSLIQDVLHNNLQGKRRILLHRKMAETLQSMYAKDLDAVAHRLALHFDEGRIAERAYEFALRGGDRASRFYAHRDAIELIRRALRNASGDQQKLEALDRLGDASRIVGNFADAVSALEEALGLAEVHQEQIRAISLKYRLVEIERDHGGTALDALRDQLDTLANEARALPAPEQLCIILWRLNELPGQKDDEALARAREALATAQQTAKPVLVARAEFNLGRTFAFGEEPGAAVPYIQQAVRIYNELNDKIGLGGCHTALGIAHGRLGAYAAAREEFGEALKHFEKAADPVNTALVLNNLGVTLLRVGDWEAAEKRLRESLRITERLDAAARVLLPLENLTELYYAKEEWPAVREYCRLLLERARMAGYWSYELVAHARMGVAFLREGDREAAIGEERAAQQIVATHPEWFDDRVYCDVLTAELAEATEDRSDALSLLENAEARLASRDLYVWAAVRLTRARIVAATSRDGALALTRDALATFERIGAAAMQQRAQVLLDSLGETA